MGARRTGSCWLRALTGLLLASALFVPGALAEPALDARLDSLRQLRLDLSGTTTADESPSWRAAVDADESHDVSAQEVGAFVSLLEALASRPEVGTLEAYNLTWAAENASGASGATLDGRANLSAFALERAPAFRLKARLDSLNGTLDHVALTFTNLSGSVGSSKPIDVLHTVRFSWGAPPAAQTVHRVEVEAPPRLAFHLRVAGGLEIVGFESLVPATLAPDRSQVDGVTIEFPAVVVVRVREVGNAAVALVIGATILPAVGVAYVTLKSARRLKVAEKPLPVEPRYK